MFELLVIVLSCALLFISAYQVLVKDNFKFTKIPEICLQKVSIKDRLYLRKSIGISYIILGLFIGLLTITRSPLVIKLIIISTVIIGIHLIRITIKFVNLR